MKELKNSYQLQYSRGILKISPVDSTILSLLKPWHKGDGLVLNAIDYRLVYRRLAKSKIPFIDKARNYNDLDFNFTASKLYGYQQTAMDGWLKEKRGVINIPTGAGKTMIAAHIIANTKRSTIVAVPTIDLMQQWHKTLSGFFDCPIGRLGGGFAEVLPITITTYDSMVNKASLLGSKFCLVILDEVHHATSSVRAKALTKFIAPYRLGLTATLNEDPEIVARLKKLVGPVVNSLAVANLTGKYLAPYDLEIIEVELTPEERDEYENCRQNYLSYRKKLNLSPSASWQTFVLRASSNEEGRKAMQDFRRQKLIAYNASEKYVKLDEILQKHDKQKILIFTNDNASAKAISAKFNIPLLIHSTMKIKRKEILDKFRSGSEQVIVSSRVLNEGIDVPEAKVAIVFSGSGTTREHRQRLGRVLRQSGGQRATLYELVSAETNETYTSLRRNIGL